MRHLVRGLLSAAALAVLSSATPAHAERVRDLCEVVGARDNQLVGYGIVTGLNGTGDDTSSPFAAQSVMALMRRLGVQVDPTQVRLRNVAAVVVTAQLAPFARQGNKIDISVASLGNAKSLSGGVLVQTLLRGADQKVYAAAQGSVLTVTVKPGAAVAPVTTSGRVPQGAIVEKEIPTSFTSEGSVRFALRNASFGVAAKIAEAVDKELGPGAAHADDGGAVTVKIPTEYAKKPVELLARLEELDVLTTRRARVIISERTQTIVAGGDVRLSPAVVVHDGLTIVVKGDKSGDPKPPPRPVAPPMAVDKNAPPGAVAPPKPEIESVRYLGSAATLGDVAGALGALGLSSRELASVLEALKSAGALEAEVIVQ
jgi:flagellar P-ring protein precursor FlgI